MTKITLIRHSESEANDLHQIAWNTDVDLSPEGKIRTEVFVNENKRQFNGVVFITWTHKRCQYLVDILKVKNNLHKIIINDRLNERGFWKITGLTKIELLNTLQQYLPNDIKQDDFTALMWLDILDDGWIPIFESNKKLRERIIWAIYDVISQYPDKDIIYQWNTWTIRALLSELMDCSEQELDKILENNIWKNTIPHLKKFQFDIEDLENPKLIQFADLPLR